MAPMHLLFFPLDKKKSPSEIIAFFSFRPFAVLSVSPKLEFLDFNFYITKPWIIFLHTERKAIFFSFFLVFCSFFNENYMKKIVQN